MKIMLFRDGRLGAAAKLPGENPEVELSDLLGGETEMISLTERLVAVTLKDGKEMGLENRYAIHRLGRSPLPVYGDCAVVAVMPNGAYRDISLVEVAAVGGYIYAAE